MSAVALGQAAESRAEPVSVFPAEVDLVPKGRQQLLVQQRLANGLVRDLSREALFSSSDPSVVSVADGVAHALGEGLAKVRVEAAGQVASVDVVGGSKPSGARLSFVAAVLPVLGPAGFANGSS